MQAKITSPAPSVRFSINECAPKEYIRISANCRITIVGNANWQCLFKAWSSSVWCAGPISPTGGRPHGERCYLSTQENMMTLSMLSDVSVEVWT